MAELHFELAPNQIVRTAKKSQTCYHDGARSRVAHLFDHTLTTRKAGVAPTEIEFEKLYGLKPIGELVPNRPPEIEQGLIEYRLEVYNERSDMDCKNFEILPSAAKPFAFGRRR